MPRQAVLENNYALFIFWLIVCIVYTTLLSMTTLLVILVSRKRRSSILKSQRAPRKPFSELEFTVATPTDTAKSRRVSFSKRTGVAEFATNEATTTWKNFYEEHNMSLESPGNDPGNSSKPVGHIGKRIFDQQFQEMEAIDFVSSHNPGINITSSINFDHQLASFETTDDVKLPAPHNRFEVSLLTNSQTKVFDDLAAVSNLELTGIDVNFSNVQMLKDDLDEIQKDYAQANEFQNNVICHGPIGDRQIMSEYIEVDLNMTHVKIANDMSDMSITDTIHSPKVQDVSKSASIDKKVIPKDLIVDKENVAVNPYTAPKETENFAVNDELDKVLVFDGKRLTLQTENKENNAPKTIEEKSIDNPKTKPVLERSQRKAIVLNMNDDLPNFFDDLNSNSSGYVSVADLKRNTMMDSDMSITKPFNLDPQYNDITQNYTATTNDKIHTQMYDNGDISVTQAVPTNIIDKTLKNETACDISMTQAVPTNIIMQEKRKTIAYDSEDSNISMTLALPSKIIAENLPAIVQNDAVNLRKSSVDTKTACDADVSITQIGNYNTIKGEEKRRTVVFDRDSADISVTQAVPSHVILETASNSDISLTPAVATNILSKDLINSILGSDIGGNLSMTQAVPSAQILNIISEASVETQPKDKRRTVVFDNDEAEISMTQAIPANIITDRQIDMLEKQDLSFKLHQTQAYKTEENKRRTIVFDNKDADLSMTQAIPTNIHQKDQIECYHLELDYRSKKASKTSSGDNVEDKRRTIVFDDSSNDISMTQALPINIFSKGNLDSENFSYQQSLNSLQTISTHESKNSINKRRTVVFDNDDADISMTQAVPTEFFQVNMVKDNLSVTNENVEYNKSETELQITENTPTIEVDQTINNKIEESTRKEIVLENEADISMTEVPTNQSSRTRNKSITIAYDNDTDVSMTRLINDVIDSINIGSETDKKLDINNISTNLNIESDKKVTDTCGDGDSPSTDKVVLTSLLRDVDRVSMNYKSEDTLSPTPSPKNKSNIEAADVIDIEEPMAVENYNDSIKQAEVKETAVRGIIHIQSINTTIHDVKRSDIVENVTKSNPIPKDISLSVIQNDAMNKLISDIDTKPVDNTNGNELLVYQMAKQSENASQPMRNQEIIQNYVMEVARQVVAADISPMTLKEEIEYELSNIDDDTLSMTSKTGHSVDNKSSVNSITKSINNKIPKHCMDEIDSGNFILKQTMDKKDSGNSVANSTGSNVTQKVEQMERSQSVQSKAFLEMHAFRAETESCESNSKNMIDTAVSSQNSLKISGTNSMAETVHSNSSNRSHEIDAECTADLATKVSDSKVISSVLSDLLDMSKTSLGDVVSDKNSKKSEISLPLVKKVEMSDDRLFYITRDSDSEADPKDRAKFDRKRFGKESLGTITTVDTMDDTADELNESLILLEEKPPKSKLNLRTNTSEDQLDSKRYTPRKSILKNDMTRMFKAANDTSELLDMISEFTDKQKPPPELYRSKNRPVSSSEDEYPSTMKTGRKSLLDNMFEKEPRLSSIDPKRLSIVVSREDVLSNLSMVSQALQKGRTDFDADSTNYNDQLMSTKGIQMSNDVVKTLKFEDEPSDFSTNSPLKKTAFGETSYMKENRLNVIPTYLKDVSDGLKQLIGDLVKPNADTLPFENSPFTNGTVARTHSTCSTQIQTNLITSSQIDLADDAYSSTHVSFGGRRCSDEPRVLRKSFLSEPKVDEKRGLVFDSLNPLNNILIPAINSSEAHKYDPIKIKESSSGVSSDPTMESKEHNEMIVQCSGVSKGIPQRDSIDKGIDTKLSNVTDIEVNTVIVMKGNKELLQVSSSLTLVEDSHDKDEKESKFITYADYKETDKMDVISESEDDKHTKGNAVKPHKRNYSPSKPGSHKNYVLSNLDITPKPANKMKKLSSSPVYRTRTLTPDLKGPKSKKVVRRPKLGLNMTVQQLMSYYNYDSANTIDLDQEIKEIIYKKLLSDAEPKSDDAKSRDAKFDMPDAIMDEESFEGKLNAKSPDARLYSKSLDAKSPDAKHYSKSLNAKSYDTKMDDISANAKSSLTNLSGKILDAKSYDAKVKGLDAKPKSDYGMMNTTSLEVVNSFTSSKNLGRSECLQPWVKSSMLEWTTPSIEKMSSDISECGSTGNVVAKIDMMPFMGSQECEWESTSIDLWSFKLLHGRLRLVVRLEHRHDNSTRTCVRADTPVLYVGLEVLESEKNSPLGIVCVRYAEHAMRHEIEQWHGARRGAARGVPALLQRCARVARLAARWARAMHDARLRLAYTIHDDGLLALKVANIPLRSVWELTFRIEMCATEGGPVPLAGAVRAARVVADRDVGDDELRAVSAAVPRDWGHVPRTVWRVFKYMKNLKNESAADLGF